MTHTTGFTTKNVHADQHFGVEHGGIHKPIHTSVQYGYERVEDLIGVFQGTMKGGYNYARQGTPTTAALEAKITQMEQGTGTVSFATGMAAITATFLTLLGYAAIAAIVLWRVPPVDAVLAAVSTLGALLLSGYATIRVLEKQSELRRGLKTFVAVLHIDKELARLAAERERLRARLLELIDAHLGTEVPRVIDRGAHDDVNSWLDAEDAD